MNFYNNSIRAKKEEQKKNPVPKILYSTTEDFYHPQQEKEKVKDLLETQKSMVQDLMDLMKNFTTELEQDDENINKNIKILNDNKNVEAKVNDNNKKEEFFLTNKNSKLAKHFNHCYKSSREKLMEDLEFAKATNTAFPIVNIDQVNNIKNKNLYAKENLILENNY